MKNKWLNNSNRQHLRYSMRQASGIALALVWEFPQQLQDRPRV